MRSFHYAMYCITYHGYITARYNTDMVYAWYKEHVTVAVLSSAETVVDDTMCNALTGDTTVKVFILSRSAIHYLNRNYLRQLIKSRRHEFEYVNAHSGIKFGNMDHKCRHGNQLQTDSPVKERAHVSHIFWLTNSFLKHMPYIQTVWTLDFSMFSRITLLAPDHL